MIADRILSDLNKPLAQTEGFLAKHKIIDDDARWLCDHIYPFHISHIHWNLQRCLESFEKPSPALSTTRLDTAVEVSIIHSAMWRAKASCWMRLAATDNPPVTPVTHDRDHREIALTQLHGIVNLTTAQGLAAVDVIEPSTFPQEDSRYSPRSS
ncbi:hypothetical protein GJ744_000134 [Endocarpon pusillum]|uniref:Uncharacterized protein n=1 Tax=Endocarpon pusillum TaxID=364733 RepID=A0A8H7AU06_9EURO|nr:hypothetical protein GJ744_000134 [Endocarpon pusillum]